ncbi:hypothetical protein Syun_016961 [Stephania yunnanensis]|uniref:Uncharacterized protein n=1 Tax=Stephania yunnanensis TaxID=152371 RepID=A0AAP0J661_9MAGN
MVTPILCGANAFTVVQCNAHCNICSFFAGKLPSRGGVEELAVEVGGAWVGFGEPDLGFLTEVGAPGGVVGEEAAAEADEDGGVEGVDGVGRGLEAHLGVGEVEDEVLPLVADVVALGGREAVCREAAVLREAVLREAEAVLREAERRRGNVEEERRERGGSREAERRCAERRRGNVEEAERRCEEAVLREARAREAMCRDRGGVEEAEAVLRGAERRPCREAMCREAARQC